jgi:hypothetical protein
MKAEIEFDGYIRWHSIITDDGRLDIGYCAVKIMISNRIANDVKNRRAICLSQEHKVESFQRDLKAEYKIITSAVRIRKIMPVQAEGLYCLHHEGRRGETASTPGPMQRLAPGRLENRPNSDNDATILRVNKKNFA